MTREVWVEMREREAPEAYLFTVRGPFSDSTCVPGIAAWGSGDQ